MWWRWTFQSIFSVFSITALTVFRPCFPSAVPTHLCSTATHYTQIFLSKRLFFFEGSVRLLPLSFPYPANSNEEMNSSALPCRLSVFIIFPVSDPPVWKMTRDEVVSPSMTSLSFSNAIKAKEAESNLVGFFFFMTNPRPWYYCGPLCYYMIDVVT